MEGVNEKNDLIKALEKLKNGIKVEEFNELFSRPLRGTLSKGDYFYNVKDDEGNDILYISPKGLDSLVKIKEDIRHGEELKQRENQHKEKIGEQRKKNKWELVIMSLLVIATLAVGLGSMYFTRESVNLTRSLVQKTSPLYPSLEIDVMDDGDDLFFSKQDLTKVYRREDGKSLSKAQIELRVYNYGKSNTGPINFHMTSNWSIRSHGYVENIEKLNHEYVRMSIWDQCIDPDKECLENKIPSGIQHLNLTIKCNGCQPMREQKKINICIWEDSEEECEKIWK